jgi:hypothetical protein
MELLDNYNKALKELLTHLKFTLGGEWTIVDCTMFYWHLVSHAVVYARDVNVDVDPFISPMIPHRFYDIRVFGSDELTGIVTGGAGTEVLQLFDNNKYVGNAKAEKIYV